CKAALKGCRFDHGSDQLETHFAEVVLDDAVFELAADDALSVEGGSLDGKGIFIGGGDHSGVGVKGTKSARITVKDLKLDKMSIAFEGRDGARLSLSDGKVDSVEQIVEAKKKEMRYGPVKIDLTNVTITNAKEEYKCGEGSVITIDGKK